MKVFLRKLFLHEKFVAMISSKLTKFRTFFAFFAHFCFRKITHPPWGTFFGYVPFIE